MDSILTNTASRMLISALILASYASRATFADTENDSAIEARPVIVSATGNPEYASRVPASVSIISRDQIANSSARNLDDLLRTERGISVLQPTGMGYGLPSQINVRGVPGQTRTLLLIDGVPQNDAGSGFININQIALEDVERVEVVRGAFSALHGADAFGGVVNIITASPRDLPKLSLSGGFGNEGYLRAFAQHSAATDRYEYTLSLGFRKIDNYLAQDEQRQTDFDMATMRPVSRTFEARNYDYEERSLNGRATVHLSDNSTLGLYARYFNSELGYGRQDRRPLYPAAVDNVIEHESHIFGAALESAVSSATTYYAKAYFRNQARDAYGLDMVGMQGEFPLFARTISESTTRDWRVDLGVQTTTLEDQILSLGIDYMNTHYDFSPLRNRDAGMRVPGSRGSSGYIENLGLYAQDYFTPTERITLVAGARLDSNSQFNEAFSPKAGARYALTETSSIRASVGRAYRAPTANELYQPAIAFGNTIFSSNPNLDPEYIMSYEAGIEQNLADERINISLGIFYNDMDDLISTAFSGNQLTYENVADAWSRGIEVGADVELNSIVSLFANYCFQESRNRATGNDLEHLPEHLANLGARLSHRSGNWTTSLSVMESFIGERGYLDLSTGAWVELDSYWRTDAALSTTYDDTYTVSVGIQNAFDKEYQEWALINPAAGRLFMIEFGLKYW